MKMDRIETQEAPKAIGPYSQAISVTMAEGRLLFVSGQIPIDPQTGKVVEGDMRLQTQRVIDNIEAILSAAGAGIESVVRTDVFLKDLKRDFAAMNEVYSTRFKGPNFPARQTVQVSELPMGVSIEISCIAALRAL